MSLTTHVLSPKQLQLNKHRTALSCAFWSPAAMGLEPEDRKRLLLVGDVEGGLAKLYSQVVGQGKQGLGLAWSAPPRKSQ